MTAAVGTTKDDPRLWVEDALSAELGVERVCVVRIREGDWEHAWATMFRLGAEAAGVAMRFTEADCRKAAEAFDLIADELGKRKAEKR